MADTINRSMSGELMQGMIDGSRKKANPDRGGIEEDTTAQARKDLSHEMYAVEVDDSYPVVTHLPDGTDFRNV